MSLGGEDRLVSSHREVDVHELQPVDLEYAVSVATLDMDERDIGIACGRASFSCKRADDLLGFGRDLTTSERASSGSARTVHPSRPRGSASPSPNGSAHRSAPCRFDVVTHHFGNAPQNALAEPARDDVLARAQPKDNRHPLGRDANRRAWSAQRGSAPKSGPSSGSAKWCCRKNFSTEIAVAHERSSLPSSETTSRAGYRSRWMRSLRSFI